MQTVKHYGKMLGSTALLLISMYLIILVTDVISDDYPAPTCRAGSIAAYLTNCEVSQ